MLKGLIKIAILPTVLSLAVLGGASGAEAGETIKCKSKQNKYTECPAAFKAPILVRQKSAQPCIINSTWGYNPKTRRIWVAAGCNGVFGEAHGYHHGAAGTHDRDAHRYNRNGTFVGIGPLVVYNTVKNSSSVRVRLDGEGGIGTQHDDDWKKIPQFDRNGNPNFDTDGNYIGPHGLGALVDAPDESQSADTDDSWQRIPQFDKEGNPNFDTDGNYIGPDGLGALVDAPVECDPEDDIPCPPTP